MKDKIVYPDGAVYIGETKNGKKHGKGKCIYPFGVYEGQYVDDVIEGVGKFTYNDGTVYYGEYKSCLRHGYGTLTTSEYHYEGYFKDDKLDGKGTIIWASKDKYTGLFKDNMLNGMGTLTYYKNKLTIKGVFKENCLPTEGSIIYSNGSEYYGGIRGIQAHGYGIRDGLRGYFEYDRLISVGNISAEEYYQREEDASKLKIDFRKDDGELLFFKKYDIKCAFSKALKLLIKSRKNNFTDNNIYFRVMNYYSKSPHVKEDEKNKVNYLLAKYYVACYLFSKDNSYKDKASKILASLVTKDDGEKIGQRCKAIQESILAIERIWLNDREDQENLFLSKLKKNSLNFEGIGHEKIKYESLFEGYDYSYSSNSSEDETDDYEDSDYSNDDSYNDSNYEKEERYILDENNEKYTLHRNIFEDREHIIDKDGKDTGYTYERNNVYDEDNNEIGYFDIYGQFRRND